MTSKPNEPRRKQRGGSIGIVWEDETRAKIKGSKTVNRLIAFVEGEISLEPHQVTAAGILLRKILPDLSASDNKTEHVHRYVARVPDKAHTSEEWQQQHERPTLQ